MKPTQLIEQERAKQIAKGFDAAHDDAHKNSEIALAAKCILWAVVQYDNPDKDITVQASVWPWGAGDWARIVAHPKKQLIVIAAALLVAELERLERAENAALGVKPFETYRDTEPPKDLPEAADRVAAKLKDAVGYLNESEMVINRKCNNGGTPYPNGAEEALQDYERLRYAQTAAAAPRTLHGYQERTWTLKGRINPETQQKEWQYQYSDGEPKSPVFGTLAEAEAWVGGNTLTGTTISIINHGKKPWCLMHNRAATHTDQFGQPCCNPALGGIAMPCAVKP
jgi:hypothetical protein